MVKKIEVLRGQRRLFGFGPKIKKYDMLYQKRKDLDFNPIDYRGKDYDERQQLAYEDAKNHLKLYQDLIREKIYPEGTKVKIKKIKHSDRYTIEMSMPWIKDIFRYEELWRTKKYGKESGDLIRKMEDIIKKHEKGESKIPLHSDTMRDLNYGIDPKTNKVVYMDYEIIGDNLPFNKRKSRQQIAIERRERRIKSLEKTVALTSIGAILVSFFIGYNQITGNAIMQNNSNKFIGLGIILFILGVLGLFLTRKK
jgi:hypothetical protein